jgi:hypothetical protein
MKGFYQTLKEIKLPSCYKVASITRACAVVQSRKKSEKRGIKVSHPTPLRPVVCIISGFFVTMKGRLFVPLRRDEYFDVQLNHHVLQTLKGKKVRSLTITPDSFSFCYSEDVEQPPVKTVYGVDREREEPDLREQLDGGADRHDRGGESQADYEGDSGLVQEGRREGEEVAGPQILEEGQSQK